MTKIFKFEIGGTVIALKCEGIHVSDWPFPFYMPFLTQKPADIQIHARRCEQLPDLPATPFLFEGACDGFREWEIYSSQNGYRLEFVHPQTQVRDKSAQIFADFTEIIFDLKQPTYTMNEIMRPLMDLVFVNYLSLHEGILIHGASVRDGDRGYVFSGKSGNGKTTTSQIWNQCEGDIEVLNDERTIIRKTKDGWRVYGTPWPGDGYLVGASSAPLARIFMISHGKKNEILSAHSVVLFQEFFSQVFSNFWDAETLSKISATCEQLVSEGIVSLMPFVPDQTAVDFVRLHEVLDARLCEAKTSLRRSGEPRRSPRGEGGLREETHARA